MAFPFSTPIDFGAYLPTTYIFDISDIQNIDVNSSEFKELIVRLYLNINNMLQILNIKDTGQYFLTTINTGQVFFNVNNDFNMLRSIFRTVVNFGALPNNTTKSVSHNIPNLGTTWSLVRFDCESTKPNTIAIDIPGWDPTNFPTSQNPIMITFDPTNVNITTTSNMSAWTITWVTLEFILT